VSGLFLVVAAYCLGSISFSLLVVKWVHGGDIRELGSRNAGASNVLRVVGRGPAISVLLLDITKGVLPVQMARAVEMPGSVVGATAVAAVFGHMFPLFHGWRGGKGVATAAGALGSLALLPAGLAVLLFFTIAVTTRYVALASLVAVTGFPLLLYLCSLVGWVAPSPGWLVASSWVIAALVVAKHQDNLRRLLSGAEHRLGDAEPEEETL